MNEFEKSRDRIVKWVEPQDNWTEEDWEHYRTVIKALDKQIPKKVNKFFKAPDGYLSNGDCPSCKERVDEGTMYCEACGQAIDWSGKR